MEGGVYTAPLLLIALSMIRSTAFGAHDYIIALLKDIAAGYTARAVKSVCFQSLVLLSLSVKAIFQRFARDICSYANCFLATISL